MKKVELNAKFNETIHVKKKQVLLNGIVCNVSSQSKLWHLSRIETIRFILVDEFPLDNEFYV